METMKRSVLARGWGGERGNRWSPEDYWGSENILCDAIVDTYHYTFVENHRLPTIKGEC